MHDPPAWDPTKRLFSGNAIGLAFFFGSFLGSGVAAAVNYTRLGRPQQAAMTLAAGFVATMALLALALSLPELPSALFTPINAGFAIGLAKLSELHFAAQFQAHQAAGGEVGMRGKGALVGLACTIGVMLPLVFASISAMELLGWG